MLEQITHDARDRRSPHLHAARELGARDRLVLTDQVEHDLPVDLPVGTTRRHAKAACVDLAHAHIVTGGPPPSSSKKTTAPSERGRARFDRDSLALTIARRAPG